MHKNLLLSIMFTIACTFSLAQLKKSTFFIVVNISVPGYYFKDQVKAVGIGIDLKREWFFSKKMLWTISTIANFFLGKYYYYDFGPNPGYKTITNFANTSVLGGIKYYPVEKFYISAETGILINYGIHPAFVPSAGLTLPVKKSGKIDVSLKLMNVLELPSIPEHTTLQRGGYGFWSLRIAYGF